MIGKRSYNHNYSETIEARNFKFDMHFTIRT